MVIIDPNIREEVKERFNKKLFDKKYPLWIPGARIPPDPVTGLCWKINKNAVRPKFMRNIEIDSSKKMIL